MHRALEALKAFLVGHNVELDAIRFNIIDDPGAGEPELGAIGLSALCCHTK